jgi:hypothetical protein
MSLRGMGVLGHANTKRKEWRSVGSLKETRARAVGAGWGHWQSRAKRAAASAAPPPPCQCRAGAISPVGKFKSKEQTRAHRAPETRDHSLNEDRITELYYAKRSGAARLHRAACSKARLHIEMTTGGCDSRNRN